MKNRWALVTGSAKRIGRAIALDLAAAGWNIALHYKTSSGDAVETAREIEALGRKACLAELDLANLPAVKRLIPALAAELGPFGALINNASTFIPDKAIADKDAHKIINAEAPRLLSEAFYAQLPHDQKGIIVNILDADPTSPAFSLYNQSKIALRDMTLDMARRFAPRVRVNGVALGPVLRGPRESAEHFQKQIKKTPLGISVPPEAVASAVRFLTEAETITGAIVPIDSGRHLKA